MGGQEALMGICDPVYAPVTFHVDPPTRPVYTALYPLRGITYFLSHPSLWKIIICPLLVTAAVAIVALALIFGLALYPQALLLDDWIGITWLAWVIAVILCLVEVLFIILITIFIFFDGTRRRIYKKVFEIEGVIVRPAGSLAQEYNAEELVSSTFERHCACWVCVDVFESIKGCLLCCCIDRKDCGWYLTMKVISLLVFLVSLPLNLIPVVGTIIFCALNGSLMAWRLQLNYFKKKTLPPSVCTYILRHRSSEYFAFGVVCLLLDLIPVIDILLIYTNIIASALWIVDIERSGMFDSMAFANELVEDEEEHFY